MIMELRDLVELLYTAQRRFSSIQIAWTYSYDVNMMNAVQERWAAMNPPGSVATLTSTATPESQQLDIHRRLWWQKPGCWREESRMGERQGSITILCNDRWWSYSPGESVLFTNVLPLDQWTKLDIRNVREGHAPAVDDLLDGAQLLDPAFLLSSHDLQPVGETTHAGREAVQVRATYQKGKSRLHEAFFWAAADALDLLVDREYGILLRYAALYDWHEYAVSSVEHVTYDEPIPETMFEFSV
jgi:hypothetical protein